VQLRVGTSSWSAKSWVGSFYPKGTRAADFLGLYARCFDTVEADVTYYRIPSAAMVDGWRSKTPPGFTISAKMPRSVVHAGQERTPDPTKLLVPEHVARDSEALLAAMGRLGDKCGPLVLQFPYFNRKVFPERGPFLERLNAYLAQLPRDFRFAVELRNKAWVDQEFLELLREHGAAFVLLDQAYMPHPDEFPAELELVTAPFSYVRLIGDRKRIDALTDRFDELVLDQGPRLRRWAALLERINGRVGELFAYANNHYAGHGPATAAQLAALVGGQEPPTKARAGAGTGLPF